MRITNGADNDDDDESATQSPSARSSPSLLPPVANTTALNCGYNCSRYVYNQPVTRHTYDMLTDDERVVIKDDYYRTYDVMTGLRTAASLGGTILLFSLFILYKMKCRHGGRRRKSLVPSSIVTMDSHQRDIEKELSLPINGNRSSFEGGGGGGGGGGVGGGGGDDVKSPPITPNVTSGGSRRGSRVVLESNPDRSTGSPPGVRVCDGAKYCGGVVVLPSVHVPRFRLNSESDDGLRVQTSVSTCFLVEPSIDIHIIQPTPNVSPCGSVRRLSEEVTAATTFSDAIGTTSSNVFIPLLSIPKAPRTKGITSGSRMRRRCDVHAADCGCASNLLPVDNRGGPSNNRSHRHRRPPNVEMKYIDGSDSDACPCDSQPTTPTTKFAPAPEVHQAARHNQSYRIVSTLDTPVIQATSVDIDGGDVSETRC